MIEKQELGGCISHTASGVRTVIRAADVYGAIHCIDFEKAGDADAGAVIINGKWDRPTLSVLFLDPDPEAVEVFSGH